MNRDDIRQQRRHILEQLYDARLSETRVRLGYVTEHHLRDALGECTFNLGYLVERGLVSADGPRYRITADGIDAVEAGSD